MPAPSLPPRKLIIDEDGQRSSYDLTEERMVAGRDPTADLVLNHPRVSRRHFEIRNIQDLLVLRDLDSQNGTFVNGERTKIHDLDPGDEIRLAPDLVIHVDRVGRPRPAVVAPPPAAARPAAPRRRPITGPVTPATRGRPITGPVTPTSPVAGAERRAPARRRSVPVGLIALVAVIGTAALVYLNLPDRSTGEPERGRPGLSEGQTRLERIIDDAPFRARPQTLADLDELLATYAGTALEEAIRAERRAIQEDANDIEGHGLDPAQSRAFLAALHSGDFTEAQELLAALGQPARLANRLDARMAKASADAQREALALRDARDAEAARTYLQERLRAFPPSSRAARELVALVATLDPARAKPPAVARGKSPRDPGTPDDQPVRSSTETAPKVDRELLRKRLEEAEALATDRELDTAIEILSEIVPAAETGGYADLTRRSGRALRACTWEKKLLEHLVAAVGDDPERVGRLPHMAGQSGKLLAIDAHGLRLASDSGPLDLKWRVVPQASINALIRKLSLPPEGMLAAASHHLRSGEHAGGERLLARALSKDPALCGAIDQILADARQMAVPAEGFTLVGDRWLSPREVSRAELNEVIAQACEQLRSDDAPVRTAAHERLVGLGDAARSTLHRQLLLLRAEILEKITKDRQWARLHAVADLRRELDQKRALALELIFDREKYPYPYKPPEASAEAMLAYRETQPEVESRVAAARELWNSQLAAEIPGRVRELVRRIHEVHEWLDAADYGDVSEFAEPWLLHLPAKGGLSVRTVGMDAADRQRLDQAVEVLAANATDPGPAKRGEQDQCRITNEYRLMLGRHALVLYAKLTLAARGHCEDMVAHGFFSHTSPVKGKESVMQRVALQGVRPRGLSENIAIAGGAQGAHNGWCRSPGHHRNILGAEWRIMGPGNAGNRWCQNFSIKDG